MDSSNETLDYSEKQILRAALQWHLDHDCAFAVMEHPVNRLPDILDDLSHLKDVEPQASAPKSAEPKKQTASQPPMINSGALIEKARERSAKAQNIAELSDALKNFEPFPLKNGVRHFVFAQGSPEADLMVIVGPSGLEEEQSGNVYAGAHGALLDAMFRAIGYARDGADHQPLYLAHLCPWRPPGGRGLTPEEYAIIRIFMLRHIALVKPKLTIVFGGDVVQAFWPKGDNGKSPTILKCRGRSVLWKELSADMQGPEEQELEGQIFPMVSPDYLLQNPMEKKRSWQDLLLAKSILSADA
jgi:DNA polymerase